MKRKAISLILSAIMIGSFSFNVKAIELKSSSEIITETGAEDGAQDQEDISSLYSNEEAITVIEENKEHFSETDEEEPTVEAELENTINQHNLTLFPGDEFTLELISKEFLTDSDQIIQIEGDLDEGYLDESNIGEHLFSITYEDISKISHTDEVLINVTGRPIIQIENEVLIDGEIFDLEHLIIKATDYEDGDLSDQVILNESEVPLGSEVNQEQFSSFSIILSVSDHDGNKTTETLNITVEKTEIIPTAVVEITPIISQTITISGLDRYKTAAAISQAMYKTSDAVILVSSEDFPDALSAGPLSRLLKAPILLTRSGSLSSPTLEEIKRLGSTKVYLLGGENAISNDVEDMLNSLNLLTERVAGTNRYSTAIASAEMLGASDTAVLVNGMDFADALTAGSYASSNGYPILLTKSDTLHKSVEEYLGKGIKNVLIVGGESAIFPIIESTLKTMGINVTRIAGSDRFNTSVEMAKYAFDGITSSVVANGLDFVDALTAVPYAASMSLPILLTSQNRVHEGVTDYLVKESISHFHFIGGESVISEQVKNSMLYPSLYPVTYRIMDLEGNWSSYSTNGETAGNLFGSGISYFEIGTSEGKDLSVRYGVSLTDLGWQNITEKESAGQSDKSINGLIMELTGSDADSYDIAYKTYTATKGWTEWVLGGNPSGGSGNDPILGIQTRIISGNALAPRKIRPVYGIVSADLNLRAGEGTDYQIIGKIPNGTRIRILSINGIWAYIRYPDAVGKDIYGYAHTGYIDQTKALLTIKGLENGDITPQKDLYISGDMAYGEGISESSYYINGIFIGNVNFGYLSDSSMYYRFDHPVQTGYHLVLPKESWIENQINVLKIEFTGIDGRKESESRYVMPVSQGIDRYIFENYTKSFTSYLNIENAKTNPPPQVWSSNGWVNATASQTENAMNPKDYVNHETYKYIFLDLSYQEGAYDITVEDLDAVLKDKGVLDGMGQVYLRAAIDFKVNPFYLIAHSLHETGNGNSRLALGQQMDFYHAEFGDPDSELIALSEEDKLKKWHNVYGIGAYDSDPILWGKERAYHENWDTVEKAVYGGAKWIADGYIDRTPFPQNTLYKMRYNLKENMLHQYATDIMWAQNQSKTIKNQFDNMGVDIPLTFIIPSFGEVRN